MMAVAVVAVFFLNCEFWHFSFYLVIYTLFFIPFDRASWNHSLLKFKFYFMYVCFSLCFASLRPEANYFLSNLKQNVSLRQRQNLSSSWTHKWKHFMESKEMAHSFNHLYTEKNTTTMNFIAKYPFDACFTTHTHSCE